MKNLAEHRAKLKFDVTLVSISEAIRKWQILSRCQLCRGGHDRLETLHITTMNMNLATQVLKTQVYALHAYSKHPTSEEQELAQAASNTGLDYDSVSASFGAYTAHPADSRVLSATMLSRVINNINNVLRECQMEAEQRLGYSQKTQPSFQMAAPMSHIGSIDGTMGAKPMELDEANFANLLQTRQLKNTMHRLEHDLRELQATTEQCRTNFMSG